MTLTIRAVFEGGVLRPIKPLALSEGETVDVTISLTRSPAPSIRAPTPAEEEYARRVKAARSLEEMYAVMATAPPLPEGYDLSRALNANRNATGERPLFSDADDGGRP